MNKPSTLDERILKAQRDIAEWPQQKLAMMQLQGTDPFRERLASKSGSHYTSPIAQNKKKIQTV